jgi:DNA mismatch endonuclease (patch repair protein)
VPGHPDIFLRKYNTAIFVHGCFWHRHQGCKYAYTPKSRVEFWQKKFDDNVRRDAIVRAALQENKVKCLVVWECTIKKMIKSRQYEAKIIEECTQFLVTETLLQEL